MLDRRAPRATTSDRWSPVGFTLVELLVVISIITLLVALLLPSLARSREVTARVVCVSNIRQVGVASITMGEDNKGWINGVNAPADPSDSTTGSEITDVNNYWVVKLNNYIAAPPDTAYNNFNTLVRRGSGCPNALTANPTAATNPNWIGYGSFAGNSQLVGWGYAPMHSLYEVKHTARISLAAECAEIWTYSTPFYLDVTCYGDIALAERARHFADGLNAVYVDGHAAFMAAPPPSAPYPASYGSAFGHWWDDTPGANDWSPIAWDFGFLKE